MRRTTRKRWLSSAVFLIQVHESSMRPSIFDMHACVCVYNI